MDPPLDRRIDLNQQASFVGGVEQESLPSPDTHIPMTLWIPLYPQQAAVTPVLCQRAQTAPVPCSAYPTPKSYESPANTNDRNWGSPPMLSQRSLSDPAGSPAGGPAAECQIPAHSQVLEKRRQKERRRDQNRKAQQSFRERKERRLRELEEELTRANAKYDALANDHKHTTTQLLKLMAEKDELLAQVSPPVDPCSPISPGAVFASRRASATDESGAFVLGNLQPEEEEELGPHLLGWPMFSEDNPRMFVNNE